MTPTPPDKLRLETSRLVLRAFRPEDGDGLFEYLSLPETYLYEPGEPLSRREAAASAAERAGDERFLAVESKEEGSLVGHLYFSRMEPAEFLAWELGFIFNPRCHNRGFCTEASGKILEHAFSDLGAHRVNAYCNPRNIASWRVLEKLGMRREGHFRQKAFFRRDADGRPLWHDCFAFGIVEDEWKRP
ncbi:MAG: GNAT family N-acetyltransferase [Spirochaetaceae bacterium]|nr:GNAT family N-acetyltransferase [Spirochaetaceae bacterium]